MMQRKKAADLDKSEIDYVTLFKKFGEVEVLDQKRNGLEQSKTYRKLNKRVNASLGNGKGISNVRYRSPGTKLDKRGQ